MQAPIGEEDRAEVNPYATPGVDRLHHTPVYVWPLPSEKKIVLALNINEVQLGKAIEDTNRYVGASRWGTFFCLLGFLVTGTILLSMKTFSPFIIIVCASCFVTLCFTVPLCSIRSQVGRIRKQFPWMWDEVQVDISSQGLRWKSESVEMLQQWDSLYTLVRWSNCMWLMTRHPFAMEYPIHRDWVDPAVWDDLYEVARAHKGFYDKEDFWRFSRPEIVTFKDAAAPDNEELSEDKIPFRARGLGNRYGCESTAAILQNTVLWQLGFYLYIFMIPTVFQYIGSTADRPRNGGNFMPWFLIFLLPTLSASMLRWFPGTGYLQSSQPLLSSQSGYVSSDSICIATPAYRLVAKLHGETKIRFADDFAIVELQKGSGQRLVIPRDQFSETDAARVWPTLDSRTAN